MLILDVYLQGEANLSLLMSLNIYWVMKYNNISKLQYIFLIYQPVFFNKHHLKPNYKSCRWAAPLKGTWTPDTCLTAPSACQVTSDPSVAHRLASWEQVSDDLPCQAGGGVLPVRGPAEALEGGTVTLWGRKQLQIFLGPERTAVLTRVVIINYI